MKINYDALLMKEADRRNWLPENISTFEQWRNAVGEVESNNIPTRMQGDSQEGIGRGKYQYETAKGSATNKTATNRLKKFLSRYDYSVSDLPKADAAELVKKDPDFSKLSEDTQDIIFLADKSEAPETNLNDLVSGNINFDDAWIQWHWKGNPKEAAKKKEQWSRNVSVQDSTVVEEVGLPELLGTDSYLRKLFN